MTSVAYVLILVPALASELCSLSTLENVQTPRSLASGPICNGALVLRHATLCSGLWSTVRGLKWTMRTFEESLAFWQRNKHKPSIRC
jgi:hypothetical protein